MIFEVSRDSIRESTGSTSCMGNHHAWDPFKVPDKTRDFNITDYRQFIDFFSDSTLPLAFKELPHVECWCSTKEEC